MAASDSRALIVVTSHDLMGETNRKTGFWYNELSAPYWALLDAGFSVDIASVKGGAAPFDPEGISDSARSEATARFLADAASCAKVQNSLPVATVSPQDYRVVFFPGGYGTMWDLAEFAPLGRLVGNVYDDGGLVVAICHGHAGLVGARRSDGKPLVAGLRVCCFTNAEEEAVGLTNVVPYLLETKLRELGAKFEPGANFQPKVVRDGRLLTGQNEQSVPLLVHELLKAVSEMGLLGAA